MLLPQENTAKKPPTPGQEIEEVAGSNFPYFQLVTRKKNKPFVPTHPNPKSASQNNTIEKMTMPLLPLQLLLSSKIQSISSCHEIFWFVFQQTVAFEQD